MNIELRFNLFFWKIVEMHFELNHFLNFKDQHSWYQNIFTLIFNESTYQFWEILIVFLDCKENNKKQLMKKVFHTLGINFR